MLQANQTPKYYNRIQSDPLFLGAFNSLLTRMYFYNQQRPKEKRYKHCSEAVFTNYMVIYTKKNFYLLDKLNEKIDQLNSAGLYAYWEGKFIFSRFSNFKHEPLIKPLRIRDLTGSFILLIAGSAISFASFIFELYREKLKS